jgi:hypothetical protein
LEVKLSKEGIDSSPSNLNNKLKSLDLQNIFSHNQIAYLIQMNNVRIWMQYVLYIAEQIVVSLLYIYFVSKCKMKLKKQDLVTKQGRSISGITFYKQSYIMLISIEL